MYKSTHKYEYQYIVILNQVGENDLVTNNIGRMDEGLIHGVEEYLSRYDYGGK